MRSLSNQVMERPNTNKDNWIQETCYMSEVTSRPDDPNQINEAWNHHSPNDRKKWREVLLKNYTVWKIRKYGET